MRIAPNSRAISASVSSVRRVLALALEEPGVLDRHRHVRAELPQHRLVDLGELPGGVAEKVQRADHPPLAAERHHQLRVRAGHGFDVARIRVHVVDEEGLPRRHRGAHQAMPDLHPKRPGDVLRIADRVRDGQLVALRIQQIDGKRLKLREPRDQLRNLVEQFVEVEDRR